MERPVRDVYAGGGVAGLEALPAIGETIARAIATLLTSGRLPMLQRLRGESDPLGGEQRAESGTPGREGNSPTAQREGLPTDEARGNG